MEKNSENLLQSLLIKNFKSVGEVSKIDFKNLTLLCGNNSSGKSTIINSLILLSQQSYSKNKLEEVKFSLTSFPLFILVFFNFSKSDECR